MTSPEESKMSIQLSHDKLEAVLVLEQGFESDMLASEAIVAQAISQAIQQSPALSSNIEDAIVAFKSHDFSVSNQFRYVIAEGVRAVDGDDEAFVLSSELQVIFDQKKRMSALRASRPLKDAEEAILNSNDEDVFDHKNRTTFMIVKAGQRIGQLTKATGGTDGIDVCGIVIPAIPGKKNSIRLDQISIEAHDDGSVYSKVAGEVSIDDNSVSICPTLVVSGFVDYSTGNIEFPGNVTISKGIKDGFKVESGKTTTAAGLVEAAEISSARDIILSVGMSGREKGSIYAARDLVAKYLDKCTCHVGRDLVIDNDICDCKVIVSRDTRSPTMTLIGGELCTLNECEIGQVGTETGTATTLTLGRMPEFDQMINRALEIINTCRIRSQDCKSRIADLEADLDSSATKAEMICQLQFEVAEHESKIKPLMDSIRNALTATDTGSPKMIVHKALCQNSEIRIGGLSAHINENIKGPISIWLDDSGEIICTDLTTSTNVPLSQYATITKAPVSFTNDDLPEDVKIAA
jgi:uncharacterized protein (DUF342 family)